MEYPVQRHGVILGTRLGLNHDGAVLDFDLRLGFSDVNPPEEAHFGGLKLDGKGGVPHPACGAVVKAVLQAVGVETWEQLKGMPVTAFCATRRDGGMLKVQGIVARHRRRKTVVFYLSEVPSLVEAIDPTGSHLPDDGPDTEGES